MANNAEFHDRFIEQRGDDGDKPSIVCNTHGVQIRNNENDMLQAAEWKQLHLLFNEVNIQPHAF